MNTCDDCNTNCKHIEECLGEGVKFERLRRVTGYLSGGGIERMNNAKQAEVNDRMTATDRVESYYTTKPHKHQV
jgi:anaerobic ribonucleoside-triphosphate reductase